MIPSYLIDTDRIIHYLNFIFYLNVYVFIKRKEGDFVWRH